MCTRNDGDLRAVVLKAVCICVLEMLVKMQMCVYVCAGFACENAEVPAPTSSNSDSVGLGWGWGDWECLPNSSGDLTQVMEIKAQPRGREGGREFARGSARGLPGVDHINPPSLKLT